jgi:hypothetical protein
MGEYTPQSRSEEILYDTIHSLEYTERPQSRIEELLLELKAVIEGGSGTTDYDDLENKPSINNVELSGDKSLADLGAASEEAVAAKASQSDIAHTFSDATAYTAGDVVYYEGSLYRFTADHAAGAWDSADVEPVTVDDLVDGLKPVDSVTDGDMRPVTSNAVYDALALKADLPVDAVTDGESKAVTSNAVYDYVREGVTLTPTDNETRAQFMARVFNAIDKTKLTPKSSISIFGNIYRISSSSSAAVYFAKTSYTFGDGNVYQQGDQLKFASTAADCFWKRLMLSTGSGSGSGNGLHWEISNIDMTQDTTSKSVLFYR